MADFLRYLDHPPAQLPELLVEEAERATGGPAAVYVVDIAGTSLRWVAGSAGLPAEIPLSTGIGPEFGEAGVRELREQLDSTVGGSVVAPLWMRGRATAMLLAGQGELADLQNLAEAAAPAVELAARYTDVLERARRHRPASAAAEIQQDLLGVRMARVSGGEIAGSMLPAYDVGGDWFDHAENPEGVWLGVADAMGRGPRAAAVSAVAIGACRATRRAGGSLEECCAAVDHEIGVLDENTFVTAVLATWLPSTRTFTWINCGHPPPLLIRRAGTITEMVGEATHPLGLWRDGRAGFQRNQRELGEGDRVLLYSDGLTDRRTLDRGFVGLDGLCDILRRLPTATAAETVIGLERSILAISDEELADDATQLVLAITA